MNATGKVIASARPTDDYFSESLWGQKTGAYVKSIQRVSAQKFDRITELAEVFNISKRLRMAKAPVTSISHHDERGSIEVSSDIEVDDE
jgi:hypothetical protein